jgi:hypothetical protein
VSGTTKSSGTAAEGLAARAADVVGSAFDAGFAAAFGGGDGAFTLAFGGGGDFDGAAGFATGFVGFCGRLLFADFPLAIGSFFFSAHVEETSTHTPVGKTGAV